jgi:mannose-1-phosphate guanylyltransferase
MNDQTIHAVIMAGGSGTRFWPASRQGRPKQFLPIAGDRTMIAETCERLDSLVPLERVLVVTSGNLAEQVFECLPDLPRENVLVEPVGRNTAPCVALAALEIERRDPDAIQLVLPADHVIRPVEEFHASLIAAVAEARRGRRLVTLGIEPTYPACGYGYIEMAEELGRHGEFVAHRVARFVEKPDEKRAVEFLSTGRFLWNAGIFVWETRGILEAMQRYAPEIVGPLEKAGRCTGLEDVYPTLPAEPIDRAVMEPADNRSVIPVGYSWNDVGSWVALPEVIAGDDEGNCRAGSGELVTLDSRENVVYGEKGTLTALIGIDGLVVVRSGDTVLVCPRARGEEVKQLVERLKNEGPEWL